MKNKTYGGYFNNPVVLILLLILICVGVYFLFNKNSFNTQILQETQPTINTTPTNTNITQATQNSLFEKQRACSQLLNDFESRTKIEMAKAGLSPEYLKQVGGSLTEDETDFVVGYSPSLDACIGGYTYQGIRTYPTTQTVEPCPFGSKVPTTQCRNYSVMHVIVNLSTNQTITPTYSYSLGDSNATTEYQEYKTKLSKLTNGQIN